MSLMSNLRISLRMIAEARSICRSFSTSSSPSKAPYDTSATSSMLSGMSRAAAEPSNLTAASGAYDSATLISNMSRRTGKPTPDQLNLGLADRLDKEKRSKDLQRMMYRRWKAGDVYAPHDLSWREAKKWQRKRTSNVDVFDVLAINPMDEYKNFAMMSEYCTSLGRIKHPRDTGLRPVNQRRVARAIRRAVGMGFLPSVHKHPEMLRRSQQT